MNFERHIHNTIQANNLLSADKTHLVALSGGADSVTLLLVLKRLGYKIAAAHCNFQLRGEESERDERFCADLCQRHEIRLHISRFDTRQYAAQNHISIEMAARDLRYDYFRMLCSTKGYDKICVGHHLQDNVETVLMNIIRGCGLEGLQGIKFINNDIVRPFLEIDKSLITQYLDSLNEVFVTDSSNLVNDVLRNKIRLDVLPLLQEAQRGIMSNVYQMICNMREVAKIVDFTVQQRLSDIYQQEKRYGKTFFKIDKEALQKEVSTEYMLYTCLKPFGFSSKVIRNITNSLANIPGRKWSNDEFTVWLDREYVWITDNEPIEMPVVSIPNCGSYQLGKVGRIIVEMVENIESIPSKEQNNVAWIEADEKLFPMTVRPVKKGERFYPLGMKGSKLVSDYLTDCKADIIAKQGQWILTNSEDKVVWLVNRRLDDRSKIKNNDKVCYKIIFNEL